ncbi:hypothetical protein FA95DRAFT_413405 [Auriscalpium vulgare]|uniref:Uncharacterized protein n=1 Tax=Auriscalpium vulgare TaxID=40419 RepID=A0ACB8S4H2_9AGAM|nr:hypothetical protein FA95DRAFT_413405 [Auriscalpium vulgare]
MALSVPHRPHAGSPRRMDLGCALPFPLRAVFFPPCTEALHVLSDVEVHLPADGGLTMVAIRSLRSAPKLRVEGSVAAVCHLVCCGATQRNPCLRCRILCTSLRVITSLGSPEG